jgi:hypothetical protein
MSNEELQKLQSEGRKKLLIGARVAKIHYNYSMQEWIDHIDTVKVCLESRLDPDVLEHIAYWVWKPIRG